MRKLRKRHLLVIGLVLAFCAAGLSAQVTTGTIWGVAKDATGGVLPGVTITITEAQKGVSRSGLTDQNGEYRITNLPPGQYRITAELPGFKRVVRSGISLSIGQQLMVPLNLELGEVAEEIIVTGETAAIDTRSSTMSGLVGGDVVEEMPLNGRSFDQLAILNPGVTRFHAGGQNVQNGPGVKMSVSGARPESLYFMLDGTNILDHSNFTPGSAAGNNLGVDAIQEFRVFTHNYSAEIGVRGGGAVSVVTKSGTNDFHGSVFHFHRNDNLDARNFFDPGDTPEFKRNQFGFSFGGPIVQDRTFFFTNMEWLRERLGRTVIAVVPTAEARMGILPGVPEPIPVNPDVQPYLDLYPLPNGEDFGDGTAERIDAFSQPTDESFFMVRIDHQFSPNDSFFARYTFDDATVVQPLDDLVRFVEIFQSRNQFLTLQESHIFSSNLLNEFRVAYNRTTPAETAEGRPPVDPSLRFFDHAVTVGELNFSPGRGPTDGAAISAVGVGGNAPRIFVQNTFQFTDNVSQRAGRHALKYGIDIQRFQLNGLLNQDTNGEFSFLGVGNLLRGTPDSVTAPIPGNDANRGFRQTLVGTYIQDDFELLPNLTLNLGLRWEFTTEPSEVDGKISNLVDVLDSEPVIGFLYENNNSLQNFAPRIGLAWDPWNDGRTSIRAGVGVFHSQVIGRNYYTYALRQTPFSGFALQRDPLFPDPFAAGVEEVPQENDRIDPNLKTPTLYHYNLSIQREIAAGFSIDVAYVGSKGAHLLRAFPANTAIPQFLPDGRPFYPEGSVPRNANFSAILELLSDSNSWYNSLQVAIDKRFSRGLRLRSTYTWGRSIDEASHLQRGQGRNNIHVPQNPLSRGDEKGLSSFHVEHAFTLNFTYDLPRASGLSGVGGALVNGWQLGGIINLNSGIPINLETGFNRSRDQNPSPADRPSLIAGVSTVPILGDPNRYYDPSVLELPEAGTYGNLGRSAIIGPDLATVDLSLIKQFRTSENTRLDFRFEAFNILNRANFSFPRARGIFRSNGRLRGSAGRISSTVTSARQLQFGLKFTF